MPQAESKSPFSKARRYSRTDSDAPLEPYASMMLLAMIWAAPAVNSRAAL